MKVLKRPKAIEGYYLETTDHLLLAVKGLVHPPERVIAYLRYIPDASGERERRGLRYRRVYHFTEQRRLLRGRYPHYRFFDPVFGTFLQGVPHQRIKRIYDPCLKLRELRNRGGLDAVEEQAFAFASLLREEARIPWEGIGISGSIMIELHTPNSDIDLVVYGTQNCRAVHEVLRTLLENPQSGVSRLDWKGLEELYAFRVKNTHLSFQDFARHERRKVIQGKYRERDYFIRFIKAPEEVKEEYGDKRYSSVGRAKIKAIVTSDEGAIFTPCIYKIGDVQIIEGYAVHDLTEVISYRGRFCEQARTDDTILAYGKVERVSERGGVSHHRLLIGGSPDDYILTETLK